MTRLRIPPPEVLLSGLIIMSLIAILLARALKPDASSCHASQPVYSGTIRVGSWDAVLQPGQSVTLPDGDMYTCVISGTQIR